MPQSWSTSQLQIIAFSWSFFLPFWNTSCVLARAQSLSFLSSEVPRGDHATSSAGECQFAGLFVFLALPPGLKSSHSPTKITQFRQLQNRKQSSKCVPGKEELWGRQAGAWGGEGSGPEHSGDLTALSLTVILFHWENH